MSYIKVKFGLIGWYKVKEFGGWEDEKFDKLYLLKWFDWLIDGRAYCTHTKIYKGDRNETVRVGNK